MAASATRITPEISTTHSPSCVRCICTSQEMGNTFVQQVRPYHHWLTFLINYGGQHGVFDAVAQVRSDDDCAVCHALGSPCGLIAGVQMTRTSSARRLCCVHRPSKMQRR